MINDDRYAQNGWYKDIPKQHKYLPHFVREANKDNQCGYSFIVSDSPRVELDCTIHYRHMENMTLGKDWHAHIRADGEVEAVWIYKYDDKVEGGWSAD